ncbi:unnamed protein product [Tenebrio molitor]|nr:unnamed protein product [Tenebrio molitor]
MRFKWNVSFLEIRTNEEPAPEADFKRPPAPLFIVANEKHLWMLRTQIFCKTPPPHRGNILVPKRQQDIFYWHFSY